MCWKRLVVFELGAVKIRVLGLKQNWDKPTLDQVGQNAGYPKVMSFQKTNLTSVVKSLAD